MPETVPNRLGGPGPINGIRRQLLRAKRVVDHHRPPGSRRCARWSTQCSTVPAYSLRALANPDAIARHPTDAHAVRPEPDARGIHPCSARRGGTRSAPTPFPTAVTAYARARSTSPSRRPLRRDVRRDARAQPTSAPSIPRGTGGNVDVLNAKLCSSVVCRREQVAYRDVLGHIGDPLRRMAANRRRRTRERAPTR